MRYTVLGKQCLTVGVRLLLRHGCYVGQSMWSVDARASWLTP
jgi:hypothetical protein